MNFQTLSDFVRSWTPWLAVFGFAWRLYATAQSRTTKWMDRLLNNHLHHVQLSLDEGLKLQKEQTELLRKIAGGI